MKRLFYGVLLLALVSCKKELPVTQQSQPVQQDMIEPSDDYVLGLFKNQRLYRHDTTETFGAMFVNNCYPEGISMLGKMTVTHIEFYFKNHGYNSTLWNYYDVVGTGFVSGLAYRGYGYLLNTGRSTADGYTYNRVARVGKWQTDQGNAVILNEHISYTYPPGGGLIDYKNTNLDTCK